MTELTNKITTQEPPSKLQLDERIENKLGNELFSPAGESIKFTTSASFFWGSEQDVSKPIKMASPQKV